MRYLGSKQCLGARRGIAFDKSKMDSEHMPTLSVVQRRRREMCEAINNSINQLATGDVVPYYPMVFPHGMNWLTGAMSYRTNIPTWWYLAAHIPQSATVVQSAMAQLGPLSDEQIRMIAGLLPNPSRLVVACRGNFVLITRDQHIIVAGLTMQFCTPARLISWWGHFTYTQGPMYVPVDDPTFLAERERRWLRDMEEQDREHMAGNRFPIEVEEEPYDDWDARRPPGGGPPPRHWEDEEHVFWRDALEYYEASYDEAYLFGGRLPLGVIGSPLDNSFRLIYSDSESDASTEELAGQPLA